MSRLGCQCENLPGTFAIRGGDDGRLHLDKLVAMEEVMEMVFAFRAEAGHQSIEWCPQPQMRYGAEILGGMVFLLQWVGLSKRVVSLRRKPQQSFGILSTSYLCVNRAKYTNSLSPEFMALFFSSRRRSPFPRNLDHSASMQPTNQLSSQSWWTEINEA